REPDAGRDEAGRKSNRGFVRAGALFQLRIQEITGKRYRAQYDKENDRDWEVDLQSDGRGQDELDESNSEPCGAVARIGLPEPDERMGNRCGMSGDDDRSDAKLEPSRGGAKDHGKEDNREGAATERPIYAYQDLAEEKEDRGNAKNPEAYFHRGGKRAQRDAIECPRQASGGCLGREIRALRPVHEAFSFV